MAYFLIMHFYCILAKLIGSNTLQQINNIQQNDQSINLTIWIQIRFPIIIEQYRLIQALRIADQDNTNQLLIGFFMNKEQKLVFYFDLQNNTKQFEDIVSNATYFDWQKIIAQREICFNKLQYFDNFMSIQCNISFNATLYIIQSISFQLFVYDQDEFENEQIIVSNLFLKNNVFTINTLKNDLIIEFYAKFYGRAMGERLLFSLLIKKDQFLDFIYYSNTILFYLGEKQINIFQTYITTDQWVLFSVQFNQLEIIIQYNINNTNNLVVLQIDEYINFLVSDYLNYQFLTKFQLKNSDTLLIQYLQIISLVKVKNQSSCITGCVFCLMDQCQDFEKKILNNSLINNVIISVNNENNLNYYVDISYCKLILQQRKDQKQINIDLALCIIINSNDQYLDNLIEITKTQTLYHNDLQYLTDLDIFIMKSNDIYLRYKLIEHVFCEIGYSFNQFNNKCQKMKKKCLYIFCTICQQQYGLVNNKCIKCQSNCLYCQIINKTLKCILMQNMYYRNSKGKVQICKNKTERFNCLPKQQAIIGLKLKGHQICQDNQIYEISQCIHMSKYQSIISMIQSCPFQSQKQEKELDLEIQDLVIGQSDQIDEQISMLISIQQFWKLFESVQQDNKNQNLLLIKKKTEVLSQMNQTLDHMSSKTLVLNDIKVFLSFPPIIIYQNQKYHQIIDIYFDLQIKFKIVQFDLLIIQHENTNYNPYFIEINYKKFQNVTFLFNINFNNLKLSYCPKLNLDPISFDQSGNFFLKFISNYLIPQQEILFAFG